MTERRYKDEGRDIAGEALSDPHRQAIDPQTGRHFRPVNVLALIPTEDGSYPENVEFVRRYALERNK